MRRFLALSIIITLMALAAAACAQDSGDVTVMGAVEKPGAYRVGPDTTLTAAIDAAGGLAKRADWRRIVLVRNAGGQSKKTIYDLQQIRYTNQAENPRVLPGDAITVPDDPWQTPVTVEFKNTPLPTAIDTLIKGMDFNYAIDPGLERARVSARLKNVPLRQAVTQVVTAAGALMSEPSDNSLTIRSTGGASASATPGSGYAKHPVGGATTKTAAPVVVVITLKYLSAADVVPLVSSVEGVTVARSTGNTLVVSGDAKSTDELKLLIASLDRPEALPRAVAVTVRATVRITRNSALDEAGIALEEAQVVLNAAEREAQAAETRAKAGIIPSSELAKAQETRDLARIRCKAAKERVANRSAETSLTTQSIGIEGSQVPLDLNAGKPDSSEVQLHMLLTPIVSAAEATEKGAPESQVISLTGTGAICGRFPVQFSKQFSVAVSVNPGESKVIASGNADTSDGAVSFEVSVHAEVEQGRVRVPPDAQQKSAPAYTPGGFGSKAGNRTRSGF